MVTQTILLLHKQTIYNLRIFYLIMSLIFIQSPLWKFISLQSRSVYLIWLIALIKLRIRVSTSAITHCIKINVGVYYEILSVLEQLWWNLLYLELTRAWNYILVVFSIESTFSTSIFLAATTARTRKYLQKMVRSVFVKHKNAYYILQNMQ